MGHNYQKYEFDVIHQTKMVNKHGNIFRQNPCSIWIVYEWNTLAWRHEAWKQMFHRHVNFSCLQLCKTPSKTLSASYVERKDGWDQQMEHDGIIEPTNIYGYALYILQEERGHETETSSPTWEVIMRHLKNSNK